MSVDIGLVVNVLLVLVALTAIGVLVAHPAPTRLTRARGLAVAVGALALSVVPLAHAVAAAYAPSRGDRDLDDRWSWPLLALASLCAAAAVYAWTLGDRARADLPESPADPIAADHDEALRSIVAARMAIELNRPDRAGAILDRCLAEARDRTIRGYDPSDA